VLFLEQQSAGGAVWDGVGAYTVLTTKTLAAAGHEVHQISCRGWQDRRDVEEDGVHVHYRPELHLRGMRVLLGLPVIRSIHQRWRERDAEVLADVRLSLSNYIAYRRLRLAVDVVEASSYPRQSLLFALFRSKPFVLTRHGISWQEMRRIFDLPDGVGGYADEQVEIPFFDKVADQLSAMEARRSQVTTMASQALADAKAKVDGRSFGARIVPISIEVEREQWSSVPSADQTEPVILAVGQVEPRKGCDVLVEAASLLGDVQGLEVVFIGAENGVQSGMPYGDWLRRRAAELGVPCRFIDRLPREKLAEWYGRARLLALPSWFDNYPVVGLEAMAAGRPVVCTSTVGYADLVAEFGAGRVVPPGNAAALADAMRKLLTDPGAAAQAGSAGPELLATHLSADMVGAERVAVYEEAIWRWRRRRPWWRRRQP
jgi:glycosyltransferase involved in cell wall biosynthesis